LRHNEAAEFEALVRVRLKGRSPSNKELAASSPITPEQAARKLVEANPEIVHRTQDEMRPRPGRTGKAITLREDYGRVPEDRLKKCHHGVPVTRTCALCDPERFRAERGME